MHIHKITSRAPSARIRSSIFVVAAALFATSLAPPQASAQFGPKDIKEVQWETAILPATKDLPARVAITAVIQEGWHVYSVTQAKGGPMKTKITVDTSSDFELSGEFAPNVEPTIHTYEDIWPDLEVEEHSGTVIWTAPLKLGAGIDPADLTIGIKVKGQACTAEQCKNFKKTLEAEL